VTGTTAVTAALGALVLLNGVLSWGTRRAEPRAQQDISRPSATALDPGAALQLRSSAWRPWPAPAEPAAAVAVAPPAPPALATATQPDIPVAVPAEASPSPDRGVPIELAPSIAPPSPPAQAAHAALTSTPVPPAGAPEVSKPPAKDRMSLAGPDAELGPVSSVHTGHDATPGRPPRSPPAAEPPGNAISAFGPENLKRLERNGF